MVCKLKSSGGYKARICIRGDQESFERTEFDIAPTMGREMLRIHVSTFANFESFVFYSVDIFKLLPN